MATAATQFFCADVEALCEKGLIPEYHLTSSQPYDLENVFSGWLAALSFKLTKQNEINSLSI